VPSDQPLIFEQRPQQLGWGDGVGNRRNLSRRSSAEADDTVEVERIDNTLEPAGPALVNRDLAPRHG
jgi:hypothetical protein